MKNLFTFIFIVSLIFYGFHPEAPAPDFNTIMRFVDKTVLGPFRAFSNLRLGVIPMFRTLFEWIKTIFPGFESDIIDELLDNLDFIF